jgi:deoxyribodipyrimidine photo-lyase
MRELNKTGFLHGRGRLIVSSFLVKILMIDYKKGEKYFANHLTDYNISNNLNNWMWITGNGASAQAYFRIFNPWLQSKEHDPECIYIKKWVPELENIPAKDIHQWSTEWIKYHNSNKNIDKTDTTTKNMNIYTKYGKPICDYEEQKEKSLKMYKDALH